MSRFMQALECRRLLHAGHEHPAGELTSCPEVAEAREELQSRSQTLRQTKRDGNKSLLDTRKAIQAEMKELADQLGRDGINEALQPLKDELRAHEKAKFKELRNANDELRLAKRDWSKKIAADLKAWREARIAGDEEAAKAAGEKLAATRQTAREALDPIRDKILASKDKWRPIIGGAHDAIQAKLVELNPDLGPLFTKLDTDATALHEKLLAEQQAVVDASKALADAIKECREESASA